MSQAFIEAFAGVEIGIGEGGKTTTTRAKGMDREKVVGVLSGRLEVTVREKEKEKKSPMVTKAFEEVCGKWETGRKE